MSDKKIGYCRACYYCRDNGGACVLKDDMAEVLQKMIDADVIVLASPVYFYSIDAQLKAVIDRTLARWTEVKNKEFYYIITCADGEKQSVMTERGVIYGTGVYQKGEVKASPAMKQAYEMGRSV